MTTTLTVDTIFNDDLHDNVYRVSDNDRTLTTSLYVLATTVGRYDDVVILPYAESGLTPLRNVVALARIMLTKYGTDLAI